MPIFEYNGKKYNVKDEHIDSFTNDYPEASTIMEREGKKYRVKSADYKTFLSEDTPQNTERATNDEELTAAPTVPEVEEPTAPTGETPLTEEDKMRMGASIAQMNRRTQQTMDNLSESMKTMREYTEKASLSGGQTSEGSMRFNQESGKFEKTYITPYGNRYSNKSVADKESFMYRQAADMSLNGQLRKANSRLREINERLEARGKELLEDKEQNQTKGVAGFIKEFGKTIAADKMGGNDGQTAEDSFEFQNDSEYQSLRLAKRELEDQIQQMENYSEKERKGERFLSDFGRNTWQAISDGDAWDFGKNQLRDAATKLSIANKANSGEELSESEQEALYELFMHDSVMSEFGDLGKGAHWGDIAGGSLSFMKDFLITGGFSGISTKLTTQIGTNIAAKAATKLSINAAESLGMRIAKDGLFATIRQGGRGVASRLLAEQGIKGSTQLLATRVLGVTAEDLLIRAPLMVTTVQGQSTAAEIINTKLGPVIVDQDTGELRFKDDKSWGEASWQTGADKVIENFSEMWGAHIPGMSDVTKVFGARNLTAALLRSTRPGAGTILSKTSEFLGKLGINGYFGEVGEEYYGQLWRTMLNLDSSKDSEGNNQFRSSDFHEDIWGGMAMSIGLTGGTTMAVNYAGKATDKTLKGAKYIHLKHELNKARAKASEVMTPEVWSELRLIIDHSDNDDMCVLARETMNDADITDEQRSAVMDYMERSMIMRGYNLGEYVRRKNGEEPNALEEELDQCYIDGYNIETSQEMNDTKNLYDYQRQRVLDIIEEDFLADIDDDPARHLEYIRDAEEWNDEERGILLDYLNAKQVYDGMIQRVRDDIDGQVERSNSIIDSRTNHTTGMIQAATMKVDNRRVYIINGNVAQNSDGGITDYTSSGSIIVRDAETGVLEQIAPESLLSIEESLDPNIEKQTSADAIRQQYAQEAANKIDGVVTFNPGDTYSIAGDDAQIQVQVVANDEGIVDNGDGTVNVSDGLNIFPIAKETIEQQTEAAQLARVAEFEQQRAVENASSKLAEKRPQYTYNDKVTLRDSEGNIIHGEIAEHNEPDDSFVVDVDYPIGGKYVPQLSRAELERMIIEHNGVAVKPIKAENSNNSDDSSNIDNNASQNIPVNGNNAPQKVISPSVDELKDPGDTQVAEQQPSAFERVPKDEHGTPLYEKTDSDTAWDAIVEQTEGDEAMAQTVADGMVADKEAALKKLEKAKSKGGATVAEKIAAEKERKAAIDAAQQELNIWKNIAGTASRRKAEKLNVQRREAEILAAQRKADEAERLSARLEAERIERESLNGVPDIIDDTPNDARARGYRRVSGHRIDRQKPLEPLQGKEVRVRFSDNVIEKGHVAIIDASQLQPSHIQGVRNPQHFIDEAQPKERNDEASVLSAQKIAKNIRPEEITTSFTAYTGAPTVNARGESIQGNNRSDALRLMWESHKEQASKYKQYLIDHADEFGLKAEEVSSLECPVLVNMLEVDDSKAITLGQYVAQDTESGGTERIKPKNALQKMGNAMRSFANLLLKSNDEDTSFAGLVDNNGVEVLKWMSQRGYITPTQYKSAFDSKGNLTAEAKNDLRGIMYQSIFKGGSTRLEEMFNTMPAKAQKAILATAFRDYDSPNAERMIEEIQNSIRAYYALSTDNAFVSAKNYKEARIAVEGWKNQYQIDDANGESILPAEKFSNFALLLAAMYKGEKQSVIHGTFNKLFDLIQGIQEPNLFEQPDNTPRTLAQAINETLNIIYNGQRRSNVLASDSSASQGGQQGSTGDAATGERVENGDRRADSAGSIESGSEQSEINGTPSLLDVVRTLYSKGKEVASKLFQRSFFDVAQTPKFMQELGLRGDKFTIKYGVIARHLGKDSSHTLTERDWEQLPQALQNPFAISKLTDKDDSYRIYTTLQTEGGEFVVVGADVKNAGREIEVNAISTVFGRRNNANLPKNEEVIYRSKEITPEQSSLLERPNFAQYPTEQELSEGKDTTISPTTNELGEKSVQEQVQAAEAEVNTNPSGNRLVTDERYAELRERMRKKLGGQMNIGIDPEILAIGTEMAVYHLETGARKFAEYAKAMIEDLGDAIRPYLKAFYNGARNLPEVESSEIADDMTPYEDVQQFNVASFDKEYIDPFTTAEIIVAEQAHQEEAEQSKQEIINNRNTERRKDDEQTSANTEAIASQAEAVADEAERIIDEATTEEEITEVEQKIDEQLNAIDEQLSKFNIDSLHSGMRVILKDGRNMLLSMVMHWGEQISATQMSKPQVHRLYALYKGQLIDIAPEDVDIDATRSLLENDKAAVPIKNEQKQSKTKKSTKKAVNLQQSGELELFDSLFDNETSKEDGLQRNDATRSEGLPSNGNRHEQGLSRGTGTDSESEQQDRGRVNGRRERAGDAVDRTVRPRLSDTVTEPKNTRNNHSDRGKDHAPTSVDARIEANIKAIELAKQLLDSGESASEKQMQTLRKFSGWGGLGKAFSEGTSYAPNNISKRLRELLGEEAYQQAVMSANSAYYTPAYVVDSLWDIAEQMGFKGGNILEGSAGIGNILGQMPTHISELSNIHAIEIDGTSGGILSLLYPDAKVEIQGFEESRIANGSVDLAITNVPFVTGLRVNDTTGDKDLSKKFHNIHDFCIAKNVRKLREGGLGIFITSNGTLDNSKKLRDWIVNEGGADFVGAFRMHNKTFGGTGVTSDIIVIRKRVNGKKSKQAIDVSTITGARVAEYDTGETRKVKGKPIPVIKQLSMDYNRYFIEHPENMAGEMHFAFEKGDTFRPTSKGLYPKGDKKQEQMLAEFVQSFTVEEFGEQATDEIEVIDAMPGKKIGEMFVSDGKLYINAIGAAQPLEVNANKVKGHTKVECFEAYSAIKEALGEVLMYQTENESDEGLQALLNNLNKAYDDFVATYGHFNKNTAIAFLRNDVDYANVFALEKYEETGDAHGNKVQQFGKTDIFSKRVVEKENDPVPTNVKDGIVASIFKYGRIDVPYIAEHLNKSAEEVKQEIIESGYGFEDPTTRQVEVSYQYLSGNVREKLRQAQENNENGVYARNIKALQEVMPMDIPAHLIDFTLGSSWIKPKLYEDYVKERTDVVVQLTAVGGTWYMNEPYYTAYEKNRAMGVTSEKLGRTVMGHSLIEAAIQNKSITVSSTKKNWDGTTETITDKEATQACGLKIDEIRQDFKEWSRAKMQSDAELSSRMERVYNDTFNNYVPMSIPDDFVPEYFGGASHKFKMRPHQGRAIVRGTMQPLLLAHEVGTGKTFTLISTAMEMRRLGTARKPMIVVQNATVGQFVASAKELYPNAKILTLEEADRSAEGRKNFYAKIRYNDWDMIVVPQSTFEFIPDSEERQMSFVQDKIEEKMLVLERMKEADPNGSSMITRHAEREVAALEEQLAELSDGASKKRSASDEKKRAVALQNAEVKAMEMLDRRTDDVENFDDMGIDALLIDEAHEYKHLGFATAMQRGVKGVDPSYSKKSQGVYLKTQAVLEKNNGRNVIFATGTPISNTAAEIWIFMRYLMPADTMKEYGIYYFDDFVRNFGNIQQMLEFSTSGKFKENNRFAGYVNLPELVRIWSGVADTVLTKEAGGVKDKIPEMEKGKAQDLYLPQTRALRSIMKYVKSELEHYDQMSGKEKKENSHIPLTMYGIAKAAAVDARLVQSDAEDDVNSKTNEAVRQTLRSLQETSSYKGSVAIFADNYQNKESGFNLYDDIRTKLIAEGVSADEIVVMKSGMTVKKKLEIFEKVNRGEVRVILGSTFTLGTGVNIQERLHTLIHLDAPNRPMDYTQRNGRILRQGNLHKDMDKPVRILRFGVEDSLDVTAYQRLKTKGAIADSIMNGKQMMTNSMTNRVLEEEEDVFGDTVAQLSGSEYAMLKNNAEKNVRKYASRKKQWEADQTYIHNAKPRLKAFIKDDEQRIEDNSRYLEAVRSSFPDGKFKEIVIGKHRYSSIEAMQEYFKDHNKSILAEMKQMKEGEVSGEQKRELSIKIGDFTYVVTTKLTRQTVRDGATLFNDVERKMHYSCPALGIEDIPVRQNLLRNAIEDIVNNVITGKDFSERLESAEHSKKHNEAELEQLLSREGKAFEYEAELEQAKSQYEEYSELMKKELEEKEAKYAELDSSVEIADDLTKTDEDDDILYRTDDEQMEFEKKLRSIKSKYGLRGGGQSIAIYDEGDLERVRMILDKDVYEKIESKFYEPNILGCSLPKMGYAFIFTSKAPDAESTWWHENTHIIYESLELADKAECGLAALNWLRKQGEFGKKHYNKATTKYEQSSWGEEGATRLVQYLIETYGAEGFLTSNFDGNEKISKLANAIRNKFIYGKEEPTEYDILQRRRIADIYGILQTGGGMDRGGRERSSSEGHLSMRSGRYGESEGVQRNAETQYGSSEEEDAREIRNREGAGAYSDDALSYENDPISKVLGRNRFAKKQRKEFAERTRQRMVERVESLAKKLHLDNVDIVESENGLKELKGNKSKGKGFYSKNTGKITIVIPNHASVFDVEQTLLHEAVAHYGLRKLFGEHFDTFLDNVFNNANIAIREQIVALASKNGWDFRKATEEYLATLAEDINFEEANKSGWWQRIKDYFLKMLHKIGFEGFSGITLTNNELRYILWRSYENLAEPGRYRSILGEAADVAKQYELKVGNYAENLAVNAEVAESNSDENFENPTIEDDDLFRDGSVEPEMHERTLARDRYESRVRSGMFQTQEALQDSMLGLKEAMLSIVGNGTNIEDIDGYENAYLGENRLSSVNKAEADAFAHTIFKPMLEEVAKLARNEAERNELIDYMMAKHGLERNTYMRSEAIKNGTDVDKALNTDYAGLTTLTGQYEVADAEAEAEAMVYVYEHSHETAKLWEKVNSVSKSILQKSYECGMMSKETFEKISEMYEFYIPLRGFDEKTSAEAYAYLTHNHSAFNAPIKKAEGRRSKADDPFANLQSMAESAIIQGNRNKLVKQRFLNFALNHPSDLVSVSEIWVEYDAISDEWKPVFPDNIDSSDSAEEVERKMQEFDSKMHELEEEYPDRYKHGKDAIGIPYRIVESRDMRQHQVVVKRGGRDYVITINGNPRAAQALNGQTNPDNDMSGAIGAILHAGEKVNRQLSAFYTTRNPDFIVSNFMRDMLYTNSMAWVKERPSYALRFHRNYLKVNPVTMKRLLAKHRNGNLDMSNKTEYLFHQFMINGGETGYTNIRDIEQHKNDIKRELKRANGRLKIGRAMSLLAEKLDEINRAVENCARFAAFVTSREIGRSIDRAIYDAKEISVNFNKKGSGAKFYNSVGQTTSGNASAFVSGLGRSGYVFWNAAIQGTTNFGRQLKRRPIKALTGAAVMFLLGAIVAYMGGDDNDDDKNAYYNLPEYVRRSNIMFRTGDSWISIPLPIEYRAFYGMGELMMSVLSQKELFTGGEIAEAVLGQATQIMPIDFLEGSGGLNAFVPSSMKPMWEAYVSEKSWTGVPLYKDSPFNKEMPEWTKAYKSANKHLVNLSATLNAASGGDAYTKGSIDINPAKVEYMLNGYFGGVSGTIDKMTKMYETWFGDREYDPRSILIWNRLVKAGDERTEYRAVNNEYFRIEKEITNTKRRLKAYENDTDKGIFDYAEKIDFLYNSPEYARYEIFEYYRRDIENLYKELQEAEDYGDKEWVRQVESDLNMRKKEMIQEMNTTRNRK